MPTTTTIAAALGDALAAVGLAACGDDTVDTGSEPTPATDTAAGDDTTALDVGHQQQVLELVHELRRDRGLTVITTMHDRTLAGQYADRLVSLDTGRVVVDGPAEEVLTEDNLARYYGAKVRIIHDGGRPVVLPLRERHA